MSWYVQTYSYGPAIFGLVLLVVAIIGLGHVIGEKKKNIIYGECYLSAIMHKKMEFGLKKSKKWIFTL